MTELKSGWLQRQFDNLKPFLCLRCGETFGGTHSCEKAEPVEYPSSPQVNPPYDPEGLNADIRKQLLNQVGSEVKPRTGDKS